MTKEELATERNEVREILEGFSEELSQSNLNKLSRVFCVINSDEKYIADLEEKNKELGDRLCNVANSLLDNWCRNEEDYCPHLAELEKENAELKAKNKWYSEQVCNNECAEVWSNLTKAKKLLQFVSEYEDMTCYADELEEIKQFLKE